MEWKADYELGSAPMDQTHREYVDLVTALANAQGEQELACFDALLAHTVEHFAQEQRWMEECGFPPIHCHQGEHERVMASLHSVRERLAAGGTGIGRIAAKELEQWFAEHAASMDNALAWYMGQVNYQPTAGSQALALA